MKKLFFLLLVFTSITVVAQEKPEGLFINSKAPEFKANDQSGVLVSLKELRKKGPVVVLFYHGYWCPYCTRELKRFQDSLTLITGKGAQLVAISPEGGDGLTKTVGKTGAVFSILSDGDMKIAKGYKVDYAVDDRTLGRYKNAGIDLLAINGQKEARLPIAAAYVVNKEGSISYRYFEEDARKSVWVSEILNELK